MRRQKVSRVHPGRALALVALLGASLLTLGATIVVDDDGGTPDLATALASASSGDTVLVMPGTYRGRFSVPPDVALIGSGAEVTILDGEGLGRTVALTWLPGTSTTLHGFTITGGSDSGLTAVVDAVIEDNIIEGNSALDGGGVRFSDCPVTFRNNVVRNNTATRVGGGIHIAGGCGAWSTYATRITNNVIEGNTANVGGGVFFYRYGGERDLPSITHNTIVGNIATQGGGVFIESYLGDYLPYEQTGRVTNNVVVGNTGGGMAILCDYHGPCGAFYPEGYPAVSGNLVYDNGPFEISGGPSGIGMDGNISQDPQFRDPATGDYRLGGSSPALDAGTILNILPVDEDSRGFPRPQEGDLAGAPMPDMGAFEDQGEVEGLVLAGDLSGVSWQPRSGVMAYHLYRGDLPTLRAGGAYTQDPALVPAAGRWCDLAQPAFSDTDMPDVGVPYFYLATPVGLVEGALGLDGDLQSRPNDNPCP